MPRRSILNDRSALIAAVQGATSIGEALGRLGLRCTGGNYVALHQACARLNVVEPVARNYRTTEAAKRANTVPLEAVMVEGSGYARSHLKRRLLAGGILENRCQNCRLGPFWHGRVLSLHLHHINGQHDDHRLKNLCLLCPNCHSQTSTYGGKKRGKADLIPRVPGLGAPGP